ncbi:MAG: glycosyltransferase family 2 protein [Chloroflexi bacterium]|nr:MAG: glycosyltransferase family 2 protein [Chloroflexota bacterium]
MMKLFWACVGFIVYTYAGYPALLAVLAKLRPRALQRDENSTPSLTLLVAAYNEEACIAGKLENSLSLDYPAGKLQILVAADGSNDRTPDIVRTFADRGVELSFSPERRGKMAAINRAMTRARGEVVVFSDANNLYDAQALRQLTPPFADPTVGAVSGAKSILSGDGALGDSEGLYWRYESAIKKQETRLGTCTGVAGEILAVRRSLFRPPPAEIINDDFYIALDLIRRGYRVIYAPAARSFERVSATAQDEVTRRARIISGRYQAMRLAPQLLPWQQPLAVWQVVSHKFSRPLVPLAMIGALVSSLLAALRANRAAAVLLTGQMAFYGLAGLGRTAEYGGKIGKLLYIPTFFVNSNLAALRGLRMHLTQRQGVLWQRVERRGNEQ